MDSPILLENDVGGDWSLPTSAAPWLDSSLLAHLLLSLLVRPPSPWTGVQRDESLGRERGKDKCSRLTVLDDGGKLLGSLVSYAKPFSDVAKCHSLTP